MMSKDWTLKRFIKNKMPHWNCPSCSSATLILEDDLTEKPTAWCQKIPEETFDENLGMMTPLYSDDIKGVKTRFSGFLKCTNKACNENVVISGYVETEEYYFEDPDFGPVAELADFYYPVFFDPPIHIIKVSEKYPSKIQSQLVKAFALYWIDNSACANKIRTIVESVLDSMKIPKKEKNKGKFNKLMLHYRLKKLKNKDAEVADFLMSIKWIGNTGSHLDTLSNKNVMDAFELLDHALNKLFIKDHIRLKKLSQGINKAKKPI